MAQLRVIYTVNDEDGEEVDPTLVDPHEVANALEAEHYGVEVLEAEWED